MELKPPPEDDKTIFNHLSDELKELKKISDNKRLLQKKHQEILAYLKEKPIAVNIEEISNSFIKSSKWPNILINSLMIYSTASGAFSTILPELIAQGIIATTFMTVACITFILPAAIALPYFIYKAKEDISKQERILWIKELILKTQQNLLTKHKHCQFDIRLDQSHREARHYFNSSALEATYLFGTLFALGIAALTTFSLSTPLGWALIGLTALIASAIYSLYHSTVKCQQFEKTNELDELQHQINQYASNHGFFKNPTHTNQPLEEITALEQKLTEEKKKNKKLEQTIKELKEQRSHSNPLPATFTFLFT